MKNIIKNEINNAKAENQKVKGEWKRHPIKMIFRILAVVTSFFITILIISLIENFSTFLGYSSIKNTVFIAKNKWANYANDVIFLILFLFFIAVFLVLVEFVADFFESKKSNCNDKNNEEAISFSKKEIEEEQSDKKYDIIAKVIVIAIPIVILLVFIGSVYVSTFNTTVFTKDEIIEKSPFNPSGMEYGYSDIVKVEIDNKNNDANLFLDLYMKNGDTVTVDYSGETDSDNENYTDYPELFVKDFVTALRAENIPITFNCSYENITEYYGDDKSLVYLKEIFDKK